ncbi:MAG: LpxI family protein [Prosthecobacter sp.]|uniref:LpxI family protein n=1 Tax=Prosthecobacter sp. TaxID=1965333 RepID=UPI0038FEE26C
MSNGINEARGTLGIIAGGGVMPLRVATAARAAGRDVFLVGLDGFAEADLLAPFPHAFARIGAAGRIVELLRANEVRDLVLVGAVRRPGLFDLRPDVEGAKMLARIGKAAFAGDDGLLRAVIKVLGEHGFKVVGVHEVLKEALGPLGLLTRTEPDAQALADIARGTEVARKLGEADVGQGCVVQLGLVLAVEAIEGTDAMLARCGPLRRAGVGGVLVKVVKPGQERRADLPTIGVHTVRNAADAGLRGIAFDAGGTLFADRDEAIALADSVGLFILGFNADQLIAMEG